MMSYDASLYTDTEKMYDGMVLEQWNIIIINVRQLTGFMKPLYYQKNPFVGSLFPLECRSDPDII